MKTNCIKCQEGQGRQCSCRAQREVPKWADWLVYVPVGFALLSVVVEVWR